MTSRRRLDVDIDDGEGDIVSKTKTETRISNQILLRSRPLSSEELWIVYGYI
jgi:hypothetical protein